MIEVSGITLFHEYVGGTDVWITAEIDAKGALVVSGSDTGDGPEEFFQSTEYEYYLTIGTRNKNAFLEALLADAGKQRELKATDSLLLALVENKFAGSPSAYSDIRNFCEDHGIPSEPFAWAPRDLGRRATPTTVHSEHPGGDDDDSPLPFDHAEGKRREDRALIQKHGREWFERNRVRLALEWLATTVIESPSDEEIDDVLTAGLDPEEKKKFWSEVNSSGAMIAHYISNLRIARQTDSVHSFQKARSKENP